MAPWWREATGHQWMWYSPPAKCGDVATRFLNALDSKNHPAYNKWDIGIHGPQLLISSVNLFLAWRSPTTARHRNRFLNPLWPSDAIWGQVVVCIGSGNGLVPSGDYYQLSPRNKLRCKFSQYTKRNIREHAFQNVVCKTEPFCQTSIG